MQNQNINKPLHSTPMTDLLKFTARQILPIHNNWKLKLLSLDLEKAKHDLKNDLHLCFPHTYEWKSIEQKVYKVCTGLYY